MYCNIGALPTRAYIKVKLRSKVHDPRAQETPFVFIIYYFQVLASHCLSQGLNVMWNALKTTARVIPVPNAKLLLFSSVIVVTTII